MSQPPLETDVLIVGGGIAGIASAERIAREAARRGRRIRIVLCEAEAKLGSGASAGLEGWYHSGSLYTRSPDLRFTRGCMRGLADLVRFYANDEAFQGRTHCNAMPLTNTFPTPRIDSTRPGWFARPVDFLLARSDPAHERDRIRGAIAAMYYTQPWIDSNGSITPPAGAPKPKERSEFERALRQAGHTGVLHGIDQRIESLRKETIGKIDRFEPVPSMDMSMDTRRVLTDLAVHAAKLGLEIRTHTRLTRWDGYVASFVDNRGRELRIRPQQCVFATGAASCNESTGPAFAPDAVLRCWTSVMVTVTPALSSRCFVLHTNDGDAAFNHFSHSGPDGDYSIIADANAVEAKLQSDEIRHIADRIVEKARAWFGDAMDTRQVRHHACSKMEASPSEAVARSYSVACGPLQDCARGEHAIWVVPGKFSLFATLGDTVHRLMEERALYDGLPTGRVTTSSFDGRLVAESKSAGLSSQRGHLRSASGVPIIRVRRAAHRPFDPMQGTT